MPSSTPILEARDLVKVYPAHGRSGPVRAVSGVSLTVHEGTCFGLLGPNGAGKTTTLEMLEDLIRPTSGEVRFRGRARHPRFREEVGIQLQTTELPAALTVRETLELFRVLYALSPAGLDPLVDLCQLGGLLDRDNARLSGGQRQRLLLAMALVHDPALVFLDEPTTGLDPQARRHLWDVIRGVKAGGRTLVLTTHYMDEAETLCDHLAILDQGRVIAEGAPDALLAQHGARDLEHLFLDLTGKDLRA